MKIKVAIKVSLNITNTLTTKQLFNTFREVFSHQNITFNDNGTVSTTPKHPLEWQEHLSEGRREDDIFMMPNIALLVSKFA